MIRQSLNEDVSLPQTYQILHLENVDLFFERLCKENMWSWNQTMDIFFEYKRFLCLAKKYKSITPSYLIDQVWHTHLLFSRDYEMMCKTYLGFTLYHIPEQPSKFTGGETPYFISKGRYKDMFGEMPPEQIWSNYFPKNNIYVNLDKSWVTPAW